MSAGVEFVTKLAANVAQAAGDPEAAHSLEDQLMRSALVLIRDGVESPREVARIALGTAHLDFPRWYS